MMHPFKPLRHRSAANLLNKQKHRVPAVDHRNRQEIEHRNGG
jgi:hypothetical protein